MEGPTGQVVHRLAMRARTCRDARTSRLALQRRQRGFTLTELMIAAAIVGIAAALALPATDSLFAKQRLRTSIQLVSTALSHGRSEAIRTGNIHLVFLGVDAQGNDLVYPDGTRAHIQVVDDGRPGSADQNCQIDTDEVAASFTAEDGVEPGVSFASSKVAGDTGNGDYTTGFTFSDADGNAASWVMFRPEGTALTFSSDCSTGGIGSGGGAVYLTDGEHDMAVVLTPLGGTRLHSWGNGWTE